VTSAERASRALGVTLVITGSVQRLGGRLLLTAALEDARRNRTLRAVTAEGPEDLAEAVVHMLDLELGAQEAEALRASTTGVAEAATLATQALGYTPYAEGRNALERYEQSRGLERAISLFNRALEQDPRYALAHAGLGEAYWRLYELTKHPELVELARQNCRRALALDDLQAPVYVTLGLISRGTGQTESALDSYARALDRDPRNADALRERGRALAGAGRIEEAESSFERALALRPSDWATYNYRGAMRVGENRLEDAARDFERVTLLAPDNPRGHTNLGVVSFKLGRLEEALTTLRRSVEIRPTAVALTNLGATLFYLERFAEAARVFGDAVALDEHNSTAWLNLGRARHHDAPGSAPARAALERAVELAEAERSVNPRDAAVLAALADANSMLGQGRRARDYAERALALAPGEPDVRALAGSVFEALGDRERALTELGAALAAGYPRWEIERDPDLAGLRADPRYTQLNPKA
jgi:tetratricopeptide (TPR) repeat protein